MRRSSVLFLAAILGTAQAQTVTHRWSFNGTGAATHGTVLPDSIGSASGTIVGTGATRTGTTLNLPGTSNGAVAASSISAYFDLPNGIVSSKTDMTVEIWATVLSSKDWQRLFDFGRMNIAGNGAPGEITNTSGSPGGGTNSSDNLMLAVQRGGNLNQQRLAAKLNGGTEFNTDNSVIISPGTQYHFVATFQAGVGANAATGGRFTWFRDGVEIGFLDTNFRLNQIEDVNNWLGRSQWTNDSNANIAYNEFRLYSGAMSLGDQIASRKAGVDAALVPVTVADAVTLAPGKKAGIPVLANDSGQAFPSSVEIVAAPVNGTASILPDGRILYTHTNLATTTDSFTYRVRGGGGLSNVSTVSVTTQDALKIANPLLNVPASPPATSLGLVNAFPLPNDPTGGLDFDNPVCLASPPGDTKRLFVCQKGGLLQMVPDVTAGTPTFSTFLNLPAVLTSGGESINTDSESGLLGLAFHPDYANNRFFYIFYSVTKSGAQRYQRVSRFTAQPSFNAADAASEVILIEQLDQDGNHNGGDLHFGPADGYLYISLGDEGDANDSRLNSQRIDKDFFSGIMRIDVDKKPGNLEPKPHPNPDYYPTNPPPDSVKRDGGIARYSIPADNPFVGVTSHIALPVNTTYLRTEFWATGLRNPWRMSFDPATGALWCGDVGQGQREEIDVIERGGNYGWVFREALLTGPRTTNPTMPPDFDANYHKPPIYNYSRGGGILQGNSVTGGLVYRGTNLPALTGKYIFGDYATGNIWSMDLNGTNVQRIAGEGGIAAFGSDPSNGDILLADENGTRILRLVATTPTQNFPETLSATGLFADLTDLAPSPGVVPYSVNLPFWSDHAIKSRWFVVPDGTSQLTWSEEGLWTLPSGTIWVKHFDMEMQRGVPVSKKRVETRLLVKNPTGAYGVSYRWNDAGTEAFLAADAGENFTLNITDGGTPVPQTWRIPSRAECMTCHTPQAGHALSFNTRQLNFENGIPGYGGNQLTVLQQAGYLSNNPGSPNLLPRHLRPDESAYSVEARVRSYLAVNCSYCHKEGGTGIGFWDGRPELTLEETGLVNGEAANNGNDLANKLVVPGDPAHSIVLNRMAVTNGFTRMPPLASNVIDTANVQLLTTWINGELDDRVTYDAWRISNFEPDNDPAGAPESDADGDGATNQEEFLAGADPNSGGSFFRPLVSQAEGQFTLSFNVPVNRSYRIETSADLGQWTPWDIPGNQGLPAAGGLIEITTPIVDSLRFFRVELEEN